MHVKPNPPTYIMPLLISTNNGETSSCTTIATQSKTSLTPSPRRTVSFAAENQYRTTLHVTDYTKAEVAACWYDAREYRLLRALNKRTVEMVQRGQPLHKEECFRGLERMTSEGIQNKLMAKITAMLAVLDEQDRQAKNGEKSDEALAHVYMKHAAYSVATAHRVGLNDRKSLTYDSSITQRRRQSTSSCRAA